MRTNANQPMQTIPMRTNPCLFSSVFVPPLNSSVSMPGDNRLKITKTPPPRGDDGLCLHFCFVNNFLVALIWGPSQAWPDPFILAATELPCAPRANSDEGTNWTC